MANWHMTGMRGGDPIDMASSISSLGVWESISKRQQQAVRRHFDFHVGEAVIGLVEVDPILDRFVGQGAAGVFVATVVDDKIPFGGVLADMESHQSLNGGMPRVG